jgi:chalcone isomerase-like protein
MVSEVRIRNTNRHSMSKETKSIRITILLFTIFLETNTNAATIEGVTFADRYQAGATTLILNNVGLLRYRVIFKGYVTALYLGEGIRPEDVLTDIPKRLELEYFWAITSSDFGKAAEKILIDNFPATQISSFRSRLDRLNALYENVKPGDRYSLTYIPGVGTELAFNGKPKGIIEGADFAAAYFAIWLGAKPIDGSLKAQLLKPAQ